MYKQLLYLHRHLFIRLTVIDLILVLTGQVYILCRGENFVFVPNLGYFFTVFVLVLSFNISQLRRFSGGSLFYLNLPLSTQRAVSLFLLFRIVMLTALIVLISTPLLLIFESSPERVSYAFHLLLFGGLVSITSLPIQTLLNKSHPEGILLSLAYLLSFIPIWIVTAIVNETLFNDQLTGTYLTPLLFLVISSKIAVKTVNRVKG